MSDDSGTTEETILHLANDWMGALQRHDMEQLNRLVAPEFTLTGGSGVVDRAAWMRTSAERVQYISFAYEEPAITVYGDVALMRSRVVQTATLDGKPWNGEFLLTDVWVRRDDNWQVVARHSTPVSGYSAGATAETTVRPTSN